MKKIVYITMSAFTLAVILGSSVLAGNENGSAGDMPAYYDSELFTINFKELPPGGEAATLLRNASINIFYMSDDGLPGGQLFISVLDAIPGDEFNPLWLEVQIHFTAGNTPHQFVSDEEISDALANGEITLEFTDEVYRCSVVGQEPAAR